MQFIYFVTYLLCGLSQGLLFPKGLTRLLVEEVANNLYFTPSILVRILLLLLCGNWDRIENLFCQLNNSSPNFPYANFNGVNTLATQLCNLLLCLFLFAIKLFLHMWIDELVAACESKGKQTTVYEWILRDTNLICRF